MNSVKAQLLCCSLVVAGLPILQPVPAQADVFNYPGKAPCNRSLQRCIDGVPNRSTIRIRTEEQIRSGLEIEKSLTLKAAAGKEPVIGGGTKFRTVDVQERPSGKKTKVVIQGISFLKTQVDVDFGQGQNHSFEITDSEFKYLGTSNAEGALSVDLDVPSTASIRRNRLTSTGDAINLSTSLDNGRARFDVVANVITGRASEESNAGLSFSQFDGGESIVNLYSNLFYENTFCFFGGNSVLDIGASFGTGNTRVNIANNTIDDAGGAGLLIRDPADTAQLTVALFNNIISSMEDEGIFVEASSPELLLPNGYNDFFDLGNPNVWSGYVPGPQTIIENPLYVDAPGRDYRLQSASTLNRRGLICSPSGLSRIDAKGDSRIDPADPTMGDPYDPPDVSMGAFELTRAAPPPGKNVMGTDGVDDLTGTAGDDVLCGLSEDDTIRARAGNDIVFAGPGADTVLGNDGDDYFSGEAGADEVTGGAGGDRLAGGSENDLLDAIDGVAGNDALNGGPGTDNCQLDVDAKTSAEDFHTGC